MTDAAEVPFRERKITFANSSTGVTLAIPSANPLNWHQAISAPAAMEQVTIDGKLFLPPKVPQRNLPVVIVVPGSLSVAPSHLAHAERFTDMGMAAVVIEPFGARGVTSTVANQTQFSFAASAYDVLATVKLLATRPEIDATRIGAQGHSRGGSAVLMAAARRFAGRVLGERPRLRAVLAAYPWCGQQFRDPDIGDTAVRVLIGDRDEWCSVQQAQGAVQAMRLRGSDATIRIFAGAAHSFDRGTPIQRIAEASVSPAAPTAYLADDGAFIHPVTGVADAKLVDRDLMVYALKSGYGVKGASIGSTGDDAKRFADDMVAFWQRALGG